MARVEKDKPMWEISIQNDVLKILKKFPKEINKSLFLFLNDYLPKDLSESKLREAKIKTLKGVYLFPKSTPKGRINVYAQIDFEHHLIKVLHIIFYPKKK